MTWNNGLRATSDYWRRVIGRRILPRDPGSPSSPFPFEKPRNGGAPETLRRAKAWARKR